MPFHLDDRFWMLDSGRKSEIYNLKSKILKVKRGFTLIELLVVIAILGILATIAIASFTSAQAKGRDARRKADLDAIKKALELSKGDSTGGTFYPGCPVGSTQCGANAALLPALTPTYIKAVPTDPLGSTGSCSFGGNFYCYNPGCTANYCTSSYILHACLENANEPLGGNVISAGPGYCGTSGKLWRITNP